VTPLEILDELISRYAALSGIKSDIQAAYEVLEKCFAHGGRLYICGNGGSASDALHIVGELMKSFVMKRPLEAGFEKNLKSACPDRAAELLSGLQGALPAYALVENSALSTAFANDVVPDMIYAQQVYGYAAPGDAVLGISTSGNAKNVINALMVARTKDAAVVGLSGGTGGLMRKFCDVLIAVPERETYKIQEYHLPIYHTLCMMLEARFFGSG
jgi:D-sedoheptulose 7-phosphate isomerase